MNLVQENIGETLQHNGMGKDVLDRTPQETKVKIEKWYYTKQRRPAW